MIIEAKLGSRPSLAWCSLLSWRSLLSAMDLLKARMIWRIGNGQTLQIWGEKWLPPPSTYVIQTPHRQLEYKAKVCDLIDPETRGWNVPLIRENFWEEEANLICNLPLSQYNQQDKLVWNATTNGNL